MSNKWNNIIREKLEAHEVSADHLWNNISQNIPQSSFSFWKPWMTTAAIGTAAIATSAIIYFNSPKSLQPTAQTTELKSEEVKTDTISTNNQSVEAPVSPAQHFDYWLKLYLFSPLRSSAQLSVQLVEEI